MRQIVLDTETTGIGHDYGHRVIEIGCVELLDRRLTGNHFHTYLNPQRSVDEGAFRVHGISGEFLQDKPLFNDVYTNFLDFIQDSELIIHNAPFDLGFLNVELGRAKWSKRLEEQCKIFDTLVYAREKHPGQRNSLDALCKRYEIDNSNRQLHGALLDAEILAWVYLTMTGGQGSLFAEDSFHTATVRQKSNSTKSLENCQFPVILATEEELHSHERMLEKIKG